ncbi:MAG: type II CAAX endopeptidase family protein [Gammaproteobacteria bacterium]|nr:type II CAAX endopeptidase family protein [Gammaproteobacteria bacterium]MDP6731424.1 type II CAAX endopeptidase family protein [Gammaproteobacteria bacterium]
MANVSTVYNTPNMTQPTKLIIDIMIVVAVTALVFYLEDLAIAQGWMPFATEIRGAFSVLAGAFAAVGVVLARGGSLTDLGFRRPQRWATVPLQVAGILIVFIAAQSLAPLLISMFIDLPEPDLSRYDSISGNLGAAIFMALVLPLTASIPEEVIYRGFLMGRLSENFEQDAAGAFMTVLIQALVFGSIHFQWGIGGMIMTFIMGIVWGTAYLLCGRNLWIVILAHSAGHLLLVTQLYLGESIIV